MRSMKRIVVGLVILLMGSFCFARQLTIHVVQHDGTQDKIIDQSLFIEDELLNSFFDKGYIVSTLVASISDSEKNDANLAAQGLIEAKEGSADYFVQIRLYYVQDKSGYTKNDGLTQVEWTIYSADKDKKLSEGTMKNLKKLKKDDELKSVSSGLVAEISKALK